MINRVLWYDDRSLPRVLTYADISSYLLTAAFLVAAVALPWALHQFHLAGPAFLPMNFLVLLGGALYGWRTGLTIGLLIPLVSYATSGMPVPVILPQITIELAVFGLVAGVLTEARLRPVWCLLGALVAGYLALLITITFLGAWGTVYSPLGTAANPLAAVWATVLLGWPGITLQVVLLPSAMEILARARRKG